MKKKSSFFRGALFVFAYFILYFIVSGAVGSFLNLFVVDGVPLYSYTSVYNIITSILVFGLPPILYCKIKKISIIDTLKIYQLNHKNIMYSVLVGVLLAPILSTLVGILGFLFFGGSAQGGVDEVIQSGFILTFISVAIVPSICEELTFRGLLVYKLKNLKVLQIAILSTLAFSLVHLNIFQGIYTFVMGFCFFYLGYYTRSVVAPIIAHFVVNGISTIQLYISMLFAKPENLVEPVQTTSMAMELLFIALSIVCAVLLFKLFGKIKEFNATSDVVSKQNNL